MSVVPRVLIDRYRCPDSLLNLTIQDDIADDAGFFRFGPKTICYGRSAVGYRRRRVGPALYDVAQDVTLEDGEVCLPFDPTEIVDNLRLRSLPGGGRLLDSYQRQKSVLLCPSCVIRLCPDTNSEVPIEGMAQAGIPELARRPDSREHLRTSAAISVASRRSRSDSVHLVLARG